MTQTYYQIDHPEGNTTGRRIFEKKGYKNGQWITTPQRLKHFIQLSIALGINFKIQHPSGETPGIISILN